MATADIIKESLFDARIIQQQPAYAVEKGGLSYTNSPFSAISQTTSQHTYNINVPSQNVFLDRAVNWTSTVQLQMLATIDIVVSPLPVGNQAVLTLGADAALCAFPLQSLVATLTATINDTTSTINLDTVMKEVLRLTDYKKNRLIRTCPTMLDKYQNYNTSYLAVNSALASYIDATESAEVGNGAYGNVFFTDAAGNVLTGTGSYAVAGFAVNVSYVDGIPIRTAAFEAVGLIYPIFLQFTSTEKLILSPFIFANAHEWETGLFGLNNIQIVCNMLSSPARVIRSTTRGGRTISGVAYNATGTAFQGSRVDCMFITPSLDVPLPAKSVVSYMEFPRYITTGSNITVGVGASVQVPTQFSVQSQTITLPQIPDMLVIYVKAGASQGVNVADNTFGDFYLPIKKISLNFDNFSGLLASHTREQLYAISAHNGLEMDYDEWIGKAYCSGVSANIQQLVGSILVLRPGQDFALQPGQAPSLVGNFTLQFNMDCEAFIAGCTSFRPDIYVIAINSGFFETLAGSSRIIKGVLNEADIISAPMAAEQTKSNLSRMVGAGEGLLGKLSNILSKGKALYTSTKPIISAVRGALPQEGMAGKIKGALGAVGYGASAGAGARSGGRKLADRLM